MDNKSTKELKETIQQLQQRLSFLEEENGRIKGELSLNSYLLNLLLDNTPDFIYFKNKQSQFIRASTAMAAKFNLENPQDVIGKTDFDFFSNEHARKAYDDEQLIMKTGNNLVNIEEVETWPDRPYTWVSTSKMCIRNTEGEVIGSFGISRDITRRKKIEQALIQSEAKYRDLYDNAPVGYHKIDLEGRIVQVNHNEALLLGYRKEEMIGRSILDFFVPEHRELARKEIIDSSDSTNGLRSAEWRYLCSDGRKIDVSLSYQPCCDEEGRPTGTLITLQDISERKKAQEKLEKTARELQATANKLKRSNDELEQFAYIASHDLQEPLRMVYSYLQLISRRYKDKLDANADDFISFAVDGARRMQGLINDLLIYSRVDTRGKPFLEVDCREILEIVTTNLKIAIEESGAELRIGPMPVIFADQGQMVQLFQNLIANAIKFRGKKVPVVEVEATKCEGYWYFTVKDNGIGIDPAYADRIFMIFQRLHTRDEFPGTGIGLSVCKKIVERHEGKIGVEIRPGGGTCFYFTIPAKNPKYEGKVPVVRS